GVLVDSGKGNSIRLNSIFDNAELGIDLGAAGVTPNDIDDTDTGANDLMNFPACVKARFDAETDTTSIRGVLRTTNPDLATVDIYGSRNAEPSCFGEGEVYLGSIKPNKSGWFCLIVPGPLAYPYVS